MLGAITLALDNTVHDWGNNDNEMARYVVEIANECKAKMPDSKRDMPACGRILKALASGSPYAFYVVAIVVLPAMFVFWQDWRLPSEKKLLLRVFNDLIEAQVAQANTSQTVISGSMENMNTTFAGFRDQITEVYFDALPKVHGDIVDHDHDHSLELIAINGITLLFRSPTYLSDSEANSIVSDMCLVVLSAGASEEISKSIITALTAISAAHPDIFQAIVLAHFIDKLPGSLPLDAQNHKEELTLVVSTLDNLLQVSCTKHSTKEYSTGAPSGVTGSFWHRNFDATMSKLFTVLDRALEQEGQEDYAKAIIAAFLVGLERFDGQLDRARLIEAEPEPHIPGEGPYTWILMRLLKLVVEVKKYEARPGSKSGSTYVGISKFPGSNNSWDEKIVEYIGIVALLVERSLLTRKSGNDPVRNWIVKHPDEPSVIWTLFSDSEGANLVGESQYKLTEGPEDKCLAIALSMYLLAGFKPKVHLINKYFELY